VPSTDQAVQQTLTTSTGALAPLTRTLNAVVQPVASILSPAMATSGPGFIAPLSQLIGSVAPISQAAGTLPLAPIGSALDPVNQAITGTGSIDQVARASVSPGPAENMRLSSAAIDGVMAAEWTTPQRYSALPSAQGGGPTSEATRDVVHSPITLLPL